jgi:hypothetical protein
MSTTLGAHRLKLITCMPQVSELEAMRKREEGNLKALQKEHQQLKKEQFKAAQALHSLRQVRHCATTLGRGWTGPWNVCGFNGPAYRQATGCSPCLHTTTWWQQPAVLK